MSNPHNSNLYMATCKYTMTNLLVYRYGPDAKAVAGAVREGVKQVYWVADGADGVRGWKVILSSFRLPMLLHNIRCHTGHNGLA